MHSSPSKQASCMVVVPVGSHHALTILQAVVMHYHSAGDGHFSPVGGYHAESDMVLILDTARFKYPPHWVPLKGLFRAMAHVDSATGRPRGFLKIRANPRVESVMFTLNQPNRCASFLE